MRYFTWNTYWVNSVGTDPTHHVNNESTRIEPLFYVGNPSSSDAIFYAVLLRGDIDVSSLSQWNVQEVSSTQVEAALKATDENATFDPETGRITVPEVPRVFL